MRSTAHLLFVVLMVVVLQSCRRDPPIEEEVPWNGGTPLVLQIPAWVTDSGHAPMLPYDNPLTVEGVDLGRRLFYEKALSDDLSMSCASCHLQANAFTDPRPFSIGTDGSVGRRNAMAIVNLAWDHFFFWDARALSLELQAFMPVVDHAEMRNTWPTVVQRLQDHPTYPGLFRKAFGTSTVDSVLVVKAIAQFERTLLSFNTRYDRFAFQGDTLALTVEEQRGMELFFRGAHCVDCHMGPLFTDHSVRNNGLDLVFDDLGLGEVSGIATQDGRFKTPTLRNIAVTGPYMHDSRFATLEEVVEFYATGVQLGSPNLDNHMFPWMAGQVNLSEQDRSDLVAFLHTLTDEDFLTNPAFSDPH